MSAAWCPGSMRLCGIALLLGACGPSALTVSLAGPGPINRGVEIDSAVVDGKQSVILPQVSFGIAVRMAVMSIVAGNDA